MGDDHANDGSGELADDDVIVIVLPLALEHQQAADALSGANEGTNKACSSFTTAAASDPRKWRPYPKQALV